MHVDYYQMAYNRIKGEVYRTFFVKFLGKRKYDDLFWKKYYWLEQTKSWDLKKFREYQMREIQKQISYAYHNTVYYKRLFDEYGWKVESFQDFQDFRRIPVLTKKDMQIHLEELRAMPRWKCKVVTTGGSTGIPTKIYHDKSQIDSIYMAYVWRWYNEGNYYPGDRAAIIRGNIIKNGCYEYVKENDELICSSMKMSEKNMKEYLRQMEKYGVTFICAYPSAAELLAKFIKNTGIAFNENGKIKSLFTSSETLTKKTRMLVEKYLHVRVLDLYGNSEQMGMIGQFRDGLYHEYMCHSYVEYLDDDNHPVKNGKGRIVATGFINRAMPILRYDTNDYAEIANSRNHKRCSAQNIVTDICGRRKRNDLIVGMDGNFVSLVAINTHADIFDHIYKIQYVQEEKGKLKLKIMPGEGYSLKDRNQIYHEFQRRLGETFELEVCETDQFDYTPRGKSKLLVQKIKI